jgi:hypothetical protein
MPILEGQRFDRHEISPRSSIIEVHIGRKARDMK